MTVALRFRGVTGTHTFEVGLTNNLRFLQPARLSTNVDTKTNGIPNSDAPIIFDDDVALNSPPDVFEDPALDVGSSGPASPQQDKRERKLSQVYSNYCNLSEIDEELDISSCDEADADDFDSDDSEYRDAAPEMDQFPIHDSFHLKILILSSLLH